MHVMFCLALAKVGLGVGRLSKATRLSGLSFDHVFRGCWGWTGRWRRQLTWERPTVQLPHSALCLMLGLCICQVSVSTTNVPRPFYKFYLWDDLPKFPGKSWTFDPSALASRGTRIAGLHSQTQLYRCLCPRPAGQPRRLLQFHTVGSNQTSPTQTLITHAPLT